MQKIRTPEPGEVQVVVLLGTTTFIGWAPATTIEGIMDSFERGASITAEERYDQTVQASIRMETARLLRGPDAEHLFTDRLAAACLWLALRHWSRSEEMAKALREQMAAAGRAVVTASIADPAPEGTMPDTSWAFMIGSEVHDGRPQLAAQPPDQVLLYQRDAPA